MEVLQVRQLRTGQYRLQVAAVVLKTYPVAQVLQVVALAQTEQLEIEQIALQERKLAAREKPDEQPEQ